MWWCMNCFRKNRAVRRAVVSWIPVLFGLTHMVLGFRIGAFERCG